MIAALHVLAALNDGRKSAPADVQILKDEFPTLAHLPMDDLCCRVIHALSGKVFEDESPLNVTNVISELRSELEQIDRQIASLEPSPRRAKKTRLRSVTEDLATAS
jgi:hypothetical protein